MTDPAAQPGAAASIAAPPPPGSALPKSAADFARDLPLIAAELQTKSPWKSRTLIGIVLAGIAMLARKHNDALADAIASPETIDAVIDIAAAGGLMLATVGRLTASAAIRCAPMAVAGALAVLMLAGCTAPTAYVAEQVEKQLDCGTADQQLLGGKGLWAVLGKLAADRVVESGDRGAIVGTLDAMQQASPLFDTWAADQASNGFPTLARADFDIAVGKVVAPALKLDVKEGIGLAAGGVSGLSLLKAVPIAERLGGVVNGGFGMLADLKAKCAALKLRGGPPAAADFAAIDTLNARTIAKLEAAKAATQ